MPIKLFLAPSLQPLHCALAPGRAAPRCQLLSCLEDFPETGLLLITDQEVFLPRAQQLIVNGQFTSRYQVVRVNPAASVDRLSKAVLKTL